MNTGPCILVVDDNRSIVRTLELVLQRHGYRVVTATTVTRLWKKRSWKNRMSYSLMWLCPD